MKFFTIILLVLAFGPSLLDCVLRGRNVPAATPVFATKTFTDAVIACKATVQVPPTAVLVRDHNKVGTLPIPSFYGKKFSIDSTISISTESQLTSESTFTGIGNVALVFKLARRVQTLWNSILHWRQRALGRLIDEIVVFYVCLWTFFTVGLALLQKRALQRPHLTLKSVVQFEGTRAPVARIEIASVEGLLLLYSYTTNSPESRDQWNGLWIPRRKYTYFLSNGPANAKWCARPPTQLSSASYCKRFRLINHGRLNWLARYSSLGAAAPHLSLSAFSYAAPLNPSSPVPARKLRNLALSKSGK